MKHVPVLVDAVVDGLAPVADGVVVDGTFGRGGHAQALLGRMGEGGRMVAIDRDPEAVRIGRDLGEPRLEMVHARFDCLRTICDARGLTGRVDAVLFDLGVSSPQLDDASRGFSMVRSGPLDMRMDPNDGEPLGTWIDRVSELELARVIAAFGEERRARRIARSIVNARPLSTTVELAAAVERVVPRRRHALHPATRTFQALRIHTNRELACLEAALPAAVDVLRVGGRVAVICFQSLEDRIAKRFLRAESRTRPGPRGLPAERAARLRVVVSKVRPSAEEVANNPRARSAVLRIAEKLGEAERE